MKFSGFGDWIEIFTGGEQTDSEGRKHDGDKVIDRVLSTFNAKEHEPPIVVGHPKDNAPAFGWVEGVKEAVRDGVRVLLMKARQVVPEFEEAVKKGLYKKRSISVYPDGRLRHVAFLGAAPPAVKGLADLSFRDDDGAITFSSELGDASYHQSTHHAEDGGMEKFKEFVEFLKFWKTEGRELLGEPAPADPDKGAAKYTEEDLKKAKDEAAAEAKKLAEGEFSEKNSKAAKEARDKEIADWVEQQIKDGKLLPAWKDAGLVAFMQSLPAEGEITFAEGKDKKDALSWFREDFLGAFTGTALFKELATKANAEGTAQFREAQADAELGKSIAAKVNPPAKS